ncbi:netrin receptor DCC-like isoform X2 [Watersipora subatra]|uniref:netrin receptor DCC-like isoform X2 n=1 Tax=Watersipora subatra TaxID=2589382 RepID=UPI00355C8E52
MTVYYSNKTAAKWTASIDSAIGLLFKITLLLFQLSHVSSKETPPIVFGETDVALFIGDTLRLMCPLDSWAPILAVNWFKDTKAILHDGSDDRFEVLSRGVLLVSNLTESDAGDYTCSSRTIDGFWVASNNSVNLSLVSSERQGPYSVVTAPPSALNAMLGEETLLECVLNPSAGETVVWLKKEVAEWRAIEESDNIEVQPNRYLKWKLTDGSIAGEVRCNITSSAGEILVSYATLITLVYAPALSDRQSTIHEMKPFTVAKLTCDIAGSPPPSFTWYKDGTQLDICHDAHMSSDGTLTLERVSASDSGLYQCMASNVYGTESVYHQLTIPLYTGIPKTPLLTSARFVSPLHVRLDWKVDQTPLPINFYSIVYTEDRCLPDILSHTTVELASKPSMCRQCEGSALTCCNLTLEVQVLYQNYKIYLIAYNSRGGRKSLPIVALALHEETTPPPINESLGLTATDFSSIVLIQWRPVEDAAYYNLKIVTDISPQGVIKLRSQQPFYIYPVRSESENLTIQVETGPEPIRYRQEVQLYVDRSKFQDAAPAATVSVRGQRSTGVMLFWTHYPNASSYYLWYRCDFRESLVSVGTEDQFFPIEGVDNQCDVVLAPLVGETPCPAAIVHYDRWCKAISTPVDVRVSPYKGEESFGYPMELTWSARHRNETCEVNYLVRWKTAIADVFSEGDAFIVRNKYRAVVEGLKADFTYEFQVIAFTNTSDITKLSDIVNYTIGPPLNAKDVMMDTRKFPNRPAVLTWSKGQSGHNINLYVVMLFEWRDGAWIRVNVTTINVEAGDSLKVEYPRLLSDTRYTVNISSINSQGTGGVTTCVFKTPPMVTTSTAVYVGSTVTRENLRGKLSLTHAQLGVIIGFALSVLVIFIAALICLIARKRFKREERILRQCRNRSSRFESSCSSYSCQQPLAVDTSNHDLSVGVPRDTLANGDIEHSLPLTVFNSPAFLSNQVTSGKDSGIDGVADDHRSSQNLEEYDDEGGALINSSLSLNSGTSAQPVFPERWSGDPDYAIDASDKQGRLRAGSECDSLLTDSQRPATPPTLHKKEIESSGYHCLDSESSCDPPDLTLHITGV